LDSRVLSYLLVFVICTTVRQLYLRSADLRQPTESTHQERIRLASTTDFPPFSIPEFRLKETVGELRAANSL